MILPKYSISLLAFLPVALADTVGYVPIGRVKEGSPGAVLGVNIPRSFLPSKRSADSSIFQLRSYIPFQEPKIPLPRWIPRDSKNNLLPRQGTSTESRQVCVEDGPSCGNGAFCFNGLGCCRSGQTGCNKSTCCAAGESCCGSGGCCPAGYDCVEIDGQPGCCLEGSDCDQPGDVVYSVEGIAQPDDDDQCVNGGFGICPSEDFCCPEGRKCLRSADGKAACERVCENDGFFVCPSNDFCCPNSAQCFVDETGRSRCRVTVVTTITSAPASTSTRASRPATSRPSSSTEEDEEVSSRTSRRVESTSEESPTPTSDILSSESPESSDPTPVESASQAPTVTGDLAAGDDEVDPVIDPLPSPNGGLDNIFTDPDNGESAAGRSYVVSATVVVVVGLTTAAFGWL